MVIILVLYALLPAEWRTSRMVILLGSVLIAAGLMLTRAIRRTRGRSADSSASTDLRPTIIVAGQAEANRIKELINRSRDHIEVIGTVSVDGNEQPPAADHLGHIDQLDDIVRVHQVGEIIFSAQDVPFAAFTRAMSALGPSLRYMLAASTTLNIVGSMNKDAEGESYAIRVHFNLSHPQARRAKRLFDLAAAVLMLVTAVIWLPLSGFHLGAVADVFRVIRGRCTFVAYHPEDPLQSTLPPLRKGLLHPGQPTPGDPEQRRLRHIDYVYARDYHWTTDLSILIQQFGRLVKPNRRHA